MSTAHEPPIPSASVYLTVADVARILRVSIATLRRWYRNGTGPNCYRVGDTVRYCRSDVDGFVLANPITRN